MQRDRSSLTALLTSPRATDAGIGPYPLIVAGPVSNLDIFPTLCDLTGIELFSADDADPCEIHFSQFVEVEGRRLPHRWWIRSGDAVFAELVVEKWTTGAAVSIDQSTED